ncbi:MAG: hypothetical protein JWN78_1428 [Bacteroidota bacterium]|nr:hypothetical protein [Bacteroidota bacterium]
MKQIHIALIVFIFCTTANAQNQKEYKGNKKEIETAYLRNTVITIDGKSFDYRILKHYTEAQLRSMSPVKRNQVLFIYTGSYTVTGTENCPSFSEKDIDVAKLETMRKENSTADIAYGNVCQVHVQLMSQQLFRQKMEELKK